MNDGDQDEIESTPFEESPVQQGIFVIAFAAVLIIAMFW